MDFFQDNPGKPAPERQTILDFNEARDDGGGSGISWTSLQTDNPASTPPFSF